MRRLISRLALRVAQYLGDLLYKPRKGKARVERCLIIPSSSTGSLGDSAMIFAITKPLRGHGAKEIEMFGDPPVGNDELINRFVPADKYFFKGSLLQKIRLISLVPRYTSVYFIGADVIDGAYRPKSVVRRISILQEAVRRGISATILGSSFNREPHPDTAHALKKLSERVNICARDPKSQARLAGLINRPVKLVADVGFLLSPLSDHPVAKEAGLWIEKQYQDGHQVIAFNANHLQIRDTPNFGQALIALLTELLAQGFSIVLIPHDIRGRRSDVSFLRDAKQLLEESSQDRVYLLAPESPGVVKHVLSKVEMLITGRMHVAILALGSSTPIFTFVYQDKFEGLIELLKLSSWDLMCSPAALVENPDTVLKRINSTFEQRGSIRNHVQRELPNVVELAKQNFE